MMPLYEIVYRGEEIAEVQAPDPLHAKIAFIERHPRVLMLMNVRAAELEVKEVKEGEA
jgi:hypothetical protein